MSAPFDYRALDLKVGKWHYHKPKKPWDSLTDWQQFTGLMYRGKKVYAGDVVVFDDDRGKTYTVVYKAPSFVARWRDEDRALTSGAVDVEVIGYRYP